MFPGINIPALQRDYRPGPQSCNLGSKLTPGVVRDLLLELTDFTGQRAEQDTDRQRAF
jgi:hypothetical protein